MAFQVSCLALRCSGEACGFLGMPGQCTRYKSKALSPRPKEAMILPMPSCLSVQGTSDRPPEPSHIPSRRVNTSTSRRCLRKRLDFLSSCAGLGPLWPHSCRWRRYQIAGILHPHGNSLAPCALQRLTCRISLLLPKQLALLPPQCVAWPFHSPASQLESSFSESCHVPIPNRGSSKPLRS